MTAAAKLLATALVAVGGLALLPALPASAATSTVTFSGVVLCRDTAWGVQGVWVENYDGSDGWATWSAFPDRPNAAMYSITVTANRPDPNVRLDVGCGGTTTSWKKTLLTPDFRARTGNIENRRCDVTSANRSRSCTPAPLGKTRQGNPGFEGYCTWGAAKKWKDFTGSYPNLSGDAFEWYQSAVDGGFQTSVVPHANSIFVKPATAASTLGHVGWVTGVRNVNGRIYMDTVEMNGGSGASAANDWKTNEFGKFVTKTREWTMSSGYHFIVAPS